MSVLDPEAMRATCACGEELWARRLGAWTLRAAILRWHEDGSMTAKCPTCKADVSVPFLTLQTPAPPSVIPALPIRRIGIRRRIAT